MFMHVKRLPAISAMLVMSELGAGPDVDPGLSEPERAELMRRRQISSRCCRRPGTRG
jgi:hypothetical protein